MDNHGLIISFELEPVEQVAASIEAGRPIFKEVEHIRIIIPGDKHTEIFRKATDADRKMYADEYSRFKRNEAEQTYGTPLREWNAVSRSVAKELEYFNVSTVEQLAGLSDQAVQKIGMGGAELVRKAKVFLESSASEGYAQKLSKENADLKERLANLEDTIREMSVHMPQKRGPGRPPKQQEDEAA